MAPFSSFVDLLTEIEDPRRAEGKLYRLPHVVLFAILAMVAGANSCRTIHSFIDVHLARFRDAFGVTWRKAPAYTTIRGILRQLDPASVEAAFRRHAAVLHDAMNGAGQRHVAIDGKSLRRSFDNFLDRRAAHILSAFASDARRTQAVAELVQAELVERVEQGEHVSRLGSPKAAQRPARRTNASCEPVPDVTASRSA
jgi:hypothetical protein